MHPQTGKSILTTRQGHPAHNNQQQRTVGSRGPATLENYHFLEKISNFDRERIPERVVHARGFVAHGDFEAYGTIGDEPAATYTRAKLFQVKGAKTPLSVRFSTVIGGRDSSEATRDPRGFAVKFRTEDGNPNYLQLPINAPREDVPVNTNQDGGPMSYRVDNRAGNPHITFEPSSVAGLDQADESYREYRPFVSGQVIRAPIDRQNNYAQAGERFRTMPQWERDDLVKNLVNLLGQCDKQIQEKMVWHFSQCDDGYGRRVTEGLGIIDHS